MRFLKISLVIIAMIMGTGKMTAQGYFYSDTLIPYFENELWGYRTKSGQVIIPPRFVRAEFFDFTGSAVVNLNDKDLNYPQGILHLNGEITLPENRPNQLRRLSTGVWLGFIKYEGKPQGVLMNDKGKFISPVRTDSIHWEKIELPDVYVPDYPGAIHKGDECTDSFVVAKRTGKGPSGKEYQEYAVVDGAGEIRMPFRRDLGKLTYLDSTIFIFSWKNKNKEGLMNIHGEVILKPRYYLIYSYSDPDNYWPLHIRPIGVCNRFEKEGCITIRGEKILPLKYDFISDFDSVMATVEQDHGDHEYYWEVALNGQRLSYPRTSMTEGVPETRLIPFRKKFRTTREQKEKLRENGEYASSHIYQWGLRIPGGKELYPPAWDYIEDKKLYPSGNHLYFFYNHGGINEKKYMVTDDGGKIIIQPGFDYIFKEGNILIGHQEGGKVFMNATGKPLFDFPTDWQCRTLGEELIFLKQYTGDKDDLYMRGTEWTLADESGKILFPWRSGIVNPDQIVKTGPGKIYFLESIVTPQPNGPLKIFFHYVRNDNEEFNPPGR